MATFIICLICFESGRLSDGHIEAIIAIIVTIFNSESSAELRRTAQKHSFNINPEDHGLHNCK